MDAHREANSQPSAEAARRPPAIVLVREANPSDAEQVEAVIADGLATLRSVYRPRHDRAQAPAVGGRMRLVADVDGRPVGTCLVERRDDALHVRELYVHSDQRRRGVARAIFDWLAQRARMVGCRAVTLYAIAETGNVAHFQRCGFSVHTIETTHEFVSTTDERQLLHDVFMRRPL